MTRTICEKGASLFRWLEKYMKPGGKFMHAAWSRVLAAVVMVVCAVLFALPIPLPASKTIPTVPIVVIALGLLEEDGYVVLAGYVAFAVALVCFAILILGPVLGYLYLTSGRAVGSRPKHQRLERRPRRNRGLTPVLPTAVPGWSGPSVALAWVRHGLAGLTVILPRRPGITLTPASRGNASQ